MKHDTEKKGKSKMLRQSDLVRPKKRLSPKKLDSDEDSEPNSIEDIEQ